MKTHDLIWGLVVIAVGLVFLASNLGYFSMTEVWPLWPVALLIMGGTTVVFPDGRSRLSGLPLLLIGGIFLAHNYDVLHIRQSWPLFVVSAGLTILGSACDSSRKRSDGRAS